MHTHIIFVLYILHTSFLLLLLVFRGVCPLWTVLYLLRLALGGKDPSDVLAHSDVVADINKSQRMHRMNKAMNIHSSIATHILTQRAPF